MSDDAICIRKAGHSGGPLVNAVIGVITEHQSRLLGELNAIVIQDAWMR